MTNKTQWNEATEAVLGAESILVVTHVKPDGDAIGSLLGLTLALRERGLNVDAAVDGGVPKFLEYLSGTETVYSKLTVSKWDLMISVDASDEERTGLVGAYGREHSGKIINLDHHATNTFFGNIYLVAPESVSATEIVYDWLVHMGGTISQSAAAALLTGLVTDTIGFRTSNVNPRTLEIVRELMLLGAPLHEIIQRTLVSRDYNDLELWKHVFPSIELKDGIISAVVTQTNLKQAGLDDMTDGGLVSTLISVEEAKIAVVFKEQSDNRVEMSFRSVVGFDVSAVAFALGGGGHKQAAGATVEGTMAEVQAQVMPLLQIALKQGEALG
ncbi:MAG: bifunctional oligoribonuclease/PAP phosphatase NrnA [Anaerolineae bacterium]|nr:bifunctional oligoribonuclease/PAP phosphatase NrnA [Anaerolineae bacterium]